MYISLFNIIQYWSVVAFSQDFTINSETMNLKFSRSFFKKCSVCFDLVKVSRPFNLHPLFLLWKYGSFCEPEKKLGQKYGGQKAGCFRNYFIPLWTSSSVHRWWIRTLLDDLISLCVKLFRLLYQEWWKKSEMYGQAGHNIQVLTKQTTFQDDKFFILWKKIDTRFAKA